MRWSSQIEGPSPNNTYGFKVTQMNLQGAKALHEVTAAMTLGCFIVGGGGGGMCSFSSCCVMLSALTNIVGAVTISSEIQREDI